MVELVVFQDGADFYIHLEGVLIDTTTAPFKVGDFDIEAAKQARSWFNESYDTKGDVIKWEGA